MKQLITIVGPNGVGKTTTAKSMIMQTMRIAYVDADWCRVMNPFLFTEKTKETVTNNIYCLLRNYLICDEIDIVVFPYAWHGERKAIYDTVIERLKSDGVVFKENIYILKCAKEENIRRAYADGREESRIKRGMEMTFSFYDKYKYRFIETTNMTPEQVAEKILQEVKSSMEDANEK